MIDQVTGSATPPPSDPPLSAENDDSIRGAFTRLYDDGRAYVSAEVEKQKVRAGLVAIGVRNAVIYAVVAFLIVFAAIVALLVGLVLTLAPVVGPFWATMIVVVAAILVAVGLLLLAKSAITHMKKAITP